ncbi:MAG: glycosyltransferase family 2 protein [Nostocales cyanobacterium]|nr:MAG: glycosyltransferase family 2 protein [Nostocales cyanobacterium]
MQSKIAAYITCYQDQKSANQCIQAIENQSIQIHSIYIVDNSNQPLLLNSSKNILLIYHHPNNIGIGEGLAQALEWAISQEYDFLWTFDQDSIPTPNCLEILLENYHKLFQQDNYEIGILAPTAFDTRMSRVVESVIFAKDHFQGIPHNSDVDFYECDSPITSGSLISIAAAKTIPVPRSDLFIDGVDFDYGLRLRMKGYHNIIIPQAMMIHHLGVPKRIKIFNKEMYIQEYSALRYYYMCRNHTYLETRFSQKIYRVTSLMRRFKSMLAKIFFILLYDSQSKKLKIWACILGIYHGLIGKLGKIW